MAEHQVSAAWRHRELVSQLLLWAAAFDREFGLGLREVALRIDPLPVSRYFLNHPEMVLGVLLHELLHAWQQEHGTPGKRNHHNEEFRRKARACGLDVDEGGRTRYDGRGPFAELLRRFGAEVPEEPPEFRRAARSCASGRAAASPPAWGPPSSTPST